LVVKQRPVSRDPHHGQATSCSGPPRPASEPCWSSPLPLGGLLEEAWSLRQDVTQRDALYVVLARRLGGRVLTTDARLGRVSALGVSVTVVG
jgi:hypothetical protein